MGSRGKKRRRADGSVATSDIVCNDQEGHWDFKLSSIVPEVDASDLQYGYMLLNIAIAGADKTVLRDDRGGSVYLDTLENLIEREFPLAQAVMHRARSLLMLVSSPEFQSRHAGDGHLPTQAMYRVASNIMNLEKFSMFNANLFEEMLVKEIEQT